MHRLLLMLSFIRKNKALVLSVIALAAVVIFSVVLFARVDVLSADVLKYQEQIAVLTERTADYEVISKQNEALVEENAGLRDEKSELYLANTGLLDDNEKLEAENDELNIANDELEIMKVDMSKSIRWVEQAKQRPQPQDEFKITYYSTSVPYDQLIPGRTVAMNSQQVADLGLKRGDEIFVISNRGWSGFYKITDSGCAYGTIDIYVNSGEIPSWGVEYGVRILI